MREIIVVTLILLAVLPSVSEVYGQATSIGDDNAHERVNRLIDDVHSRVNAAAEAATYIIEADRHRQRAQRLGASGQDEAARAELQLAAEVIAGADAAVQSDLLFRDYATDLRQVTGALDAAKQTLVGGGVPRQVKIVSDLSFIERVLKANSLPPQLTAVVMVESNGNPAALSPKGARGLWQLMPDTARRYGLRVDDQVDERVDPIKSTYGAVRYLRDLYEMFHDWPLALAAYNSGENRIQSLIDKMGVRRFSEMSARRLLPAETTHYVLAVLSLISQREITDE